MSEAPQQDADVAARIDAALDELYNLEQLVGSYDEGKQVAVQASFANAARSLEGIEAAVPALEGLDVPVKLLEWIDAGKDADSFYQALMRECIGTAQVRPALSAVLHPSAALHRRREGLQSARTAGCRVQPRSTCSWACAAPQRCVQ